MSSSTSAVEPEVVHHPRREVLDDDVRIGDQFTEQPATVVREPKSSVTDRLLVFIAWNTQPYSHQSSTSLRMPPE